MPKKSFCMYNGDDAILWTPTLEWVQRAVWNKRLESMNPEERSFAWLNLRVESFGGKIEYKGAKTDFNIFCLSFPDGIVIRRNEIQMRDTHACLDSPYDDERKYTPGDLWLGRLYTALTTGGCYCYRNFPPPDHKCNRIRLAARLRSKLRMDGRAVHS